MKEFLCLFGNPHQNIKNIIHVGGTNGKGSVCNFIKNILIKSGYSVNLYISPHLVFLNERFDLNGEIVSDCKLNEIFDYINRRLSNADISFFEKTTLIALLLFEKYQADFNIIEVGLGGRKDATNVFDKVLCSVLTSISIDHQEFLGNTIEDIAIEKAEIIKQNCSVFTSNIGIILDIITKKADKMNAKIHSFITNHIMINQITPSLLGNHQVINANLAIDVCKYIKNELNYSKITDITIKKAIESTKWSARLEKISLFNYKKTEIFLDGAHNEDGIRALFDFIRQTNANYTKTIGIFMCLENRNPSDFVKYIKNNLTKIILPKFDISTAPRAFFNANDLLKLFTENDIISSIIDEIDDIKTAIPDEKNTRIIFFGSLYFCGYIKNFSK